MAAASKDRFRVISIIVIWLFAGPGLAFAQQMGRSQTLELNCVHLYPIQMKYLEKHVNFGQLTGNLEARTIEQYIKRIDPQKLYLMEKDAAAIKSQMAGIFKKSQLKDCSPIDRVQKTFENRVNERVAYAKKYLGPKFVFNDKTKIILDPDHRKRGKSEAEVNKYHNSYIQYQVSTYLAADMKLEEAKAQVVRNYERLARRVKDMTKQDIWSSYLDSFARSLDPHSSYLSADALEDFEIQMRLSLQGIGATLSSQDGFTVIEQLIPGGAAANSGKFRPKDKIISVAQGEDGEFQHVIEMDLRDVVRLIRGKKGSKVKLRVLRKSPKETEQFDVVLVRDEVKLEDDAASITYIDREINGAKKKIGLLNLPSFYADNRREGPSAARDMKKLLAEANQQGADAIVLDMSTNGGGSLRDAVDIAGLFFSTGNVVKQSQRASTQDQYEYEVLKDSDPTVDWAGPLVLLTSRVSASASEIVSGTLQDYKRAVVVGGDHTFGKGTVQSVEYLPLGLGAIKTTVGMFFVAGGNSTQHRGVDSNIVLPSVYSTDDIGEKTLDYSLPPKKIKEFTSPSAFVTEGKGMWKTLDEKLVGRLRKKSESRVASSAEFKKVKEDISKIKKKGSEILISDLIKDKAKGKKEKEKSSSEKSNASPEDQLDADESANFNLSREERKKKYLERAEVQEAINVAFDLSFELSGASVPVTAKEKAEETVVKAPDTGSGKGSASDQDHKVAPSNN